jgi:hypothetical protein
MPHIIWSKFIDSQVKLKEEIQNSFEQMNWKEI